MSRVVELVVRLFTMLAGYLVACLTASAFLHLLTLPLLGFTRAEIPYVLAGGGLFSIPFVALFVGYFAFVPAIVLVGIAELRGYRSWLFHTMSGAAAGLVTVVLFRRGAPEDMAMQADASGELPFVLMPEVALAVIAAGAIGGIAYWAVAGRSAGRWLDGYPPTGPAPSGS